MKRPQKILVLDDDENDYLLMDYLLRQTYGAGISINWAGTSATASKLVKDDNYDVCLVDYYLNDGTNGLEWAQAMISSLGPECPPLIMLTGIESCETIDLNASESGIADFISKPELTAKQLEHSIRYAIQTRHMLREHLRCEMRFHLFFDHAYEGILLLDQNGKVLQANRSAENMFCYENGTMQGLYIHQLINEFSLEYFLLNNQIAGQETPSVMERMVGKDQRGGGTGFGNGYKYGQGGRRDFLFHQPDRHKTSSGATGRACQAGAYRPVDRANEQAPFPPARRSGIFPCRTHTTPTIHDDARHRPLQEG